MNGRWIRMNPISRTSGLRLRTQVLSLILAVMHCRAKLWPHQGTEQNYGHGIIQNALAKNQVEQQGRHVHLCKDRQRGHRVRGRDQSTCTCPGMSPAGYCATWVCCTRAPMGHMRVAWP